MRRQAGVLLAAVWTAGCGGWQSALDPASPGAAAIADLWWIMFWTTGIAASLVIAILLYAVYRARRAAAGDGAGGTLPWRERSVILAGGAVFPGVILFAFLVLTVRTGSKVARPPEPPAVVIEVTGHKFWWEVRYPEYDVTTANEIHVPAGLPVEARVTSADVIHSFWVPKLAPGKIDMNPGHVNTIWLYAEEPGVYRGQCTEYCGTQHALMSLLVIAVPPSEFAAWVARRQQPPPLPADTMAQRGRRVFFRAECAYCHVIRGVVEPAYTRDVGPDLTDLASRRTLGAATIRNNRGNLAGWILNPHQFKPGNRMPATTLDPVDLRALLAYLETLR